MNDNNMISLQSLREEKYKEWEAGVISVINILQAVSYTGFKINIKKQRWSPAKNCS